MCPFLLHSENLLLLLRKQASHWSLCFISSFPVTAQPGNYLQLKTLMMRSDTCMRPASPGSLGRIMDGSPGLSRNLLTQTREADLPGSQLQMFSTWWKWRGSLLLLLSSEPGLVSELCHWCLTVYTMLTPLRRFYLHLPCSCSVKGALQVGREWELEPLEAVCKKTLGIL